LDKKYTISILIVSLIILHSEQKSELKKPDYELLINEYLRRETQGEFLQQSDWLKENVINLMAGFDAVILVKNYHYNIEYNKKDSVIIRVVYNKIADVLQSSEGAYVKFDTSEIEVDYELIKTQSKWKINHPGTNPHVSLDFMKHYLSEKEVDKLNKMGLLNSP